MPPLNGKKFQKGQSGNPGGLSKEHAEIARICREKGKDAIETIVGLAQRARSESIKLAAAQYLIDRGFGKPKQSVGLESDGELVVRVEYVERGPREE